MEPGLIRKQIIEFAANKPPIWIITDGKPDKTKIKAFLENKDILAYVNNTLGQKIKKLKPGPIYECAVKLILNLESNKKLFIKKHSIYANKSIIPDGYNKTHISLNNFELFRGPIEIKGFSHGETGTADEKNLGIVCKYLYYPYDLDDKLTVILCGSITSVNKLLLKQTIEYHSWINDNSTEHVIMPLCLKEFWKQANFNGFISFDDINCPEILLNNLSL